MTDPTDKRIEELRQYIPPYTAPNHPPQVKVITTTNTGDTPMTEEDPDLLAGDNLDRLRGRTLMTNHLDRMRAESDWLKAELTLRAEIERLRNERDRARRLYCAALSQIRDNQQDEESIADEIGWDCYKENS